MMRSRKRRFGLASHPLMPAPIASPIGVRWVKRAHAWTGISTAILALIFAWSGFMLNHRTHFTLGAPAQTTQFTIPAPAAWMVGSSEIAITQSDRGFNRIVNRLHAGRGMEGGSWHFIISAYAVMLLFLSLSGVMLWSRLSGTARVGGGLLGASLLLIGAWIVIGP